MLTMVGYGIFYEHSTINEGWKRRPWAFSVILHKMCRIPNLVMKHSHTTMSDCEFIKKEYQAGECMIVELLYPKGALSLTEMLTMLKGQSQQQY